MPDAMMNGGFAPYLAQAFTPQGVQSGLFGGGVGNSPGNIFTNPSFGQNYAQGAMAGGGLPFMAPSQLGQAYSQPYTGWQQPWQLGANPLGQIGGSLGWPHSQAQFGQNFAQPYGGGQEPLILAHLLRQYAGPISAVMASPYGQPHIAQHIVQTAEMLTRILPLVGAPQLIPLAHFLGQNAVPISAAIASPYGQAQIAQNLLQMAEMLARVLPVVSQSRCHSPRSLTCSASSNNIPLNRALLLLVDRANLASFLLSRVT